MSVRNQKCSIVPYSGCCYLKNTTVDILIESETCITTNDSLPHQKHQPSNLTWEVVKEVIFFYYVLQGQISTSCRNLMAALDLIIYYMTP